MPVSTVTGAAYLGSWQPLEPLQTVSDTVEADGSVDTGAASTPADPLNMSLTSPNAGDVVIHMINPLTPPPAGFGLLGFEFQITAPDASVADPLLLTFTVDVSLLPAGVTAENVEILRDGTALGNCTDPGAVPDPCVAERSTLGDGDLSLAIRSSHASSWSIAAPDAIPPETTITAAPPKRTTKRSGHIPLRGLGAALHLCLPRRLAPVLRLHLAVSDRAPELRQAHVRGHRLRRGPEPGPDRSPEDPQDRPLTRSPER